MSQYIQKQTRGGGFEILLLQGGYGIDKQQTTPIKPLPPMLNCYSLISWTKEVFQSILNKLMIFFNFAGNWFTFNEIQIVVYNVQRTECTVSRGIW